ncbi:MAG: hypothetical protein WA049_20055 [Ferribacterium limneticum]
MTTPTRERVVQWAKAAYLRTGGNGNYAVCNISELELLCQAARADLAATVAEQAKEIERLKEDVNHWRYQADEAGHTRVMLGNKIAASLAREAQLREALQHHHDINNGRGLDMSNSLSQLRVSSYKHGPLCRITEAALATPSDDSALREYGAKLVERVVSYMKKLDANATLVSGVQEYGNMIANGQI